jgi:SLT domain-containing protein
MAGLEVAYRQGLLAIRTLWSSFKEWLIGLFADMFAGIFQMLADFQAKLVGGVNYIREKLGFEPIQGLQFVDNWAAGEPTKPAR